MKTLKLLFTTLLFAAIAHTGFAQTKTEKIKVLGECNTCKKHIETAAKDAGATYAVWNKNTKELVFKFDASAASTDKIEQSIANAGYDTPDYKATDEAYNKLDECCQYDRSQPVAKDVKSEAKCMKDGKCMKDMECCKGDTKKDCCKKA